MRSEMIAFLFIQPPAESPPPQSKWPQ